MDVLTIALHPRRGFGDWVEQRSRAMAAVVVVAAALAAGGILLVFEVVRLVQALLDSAGAVDLATGVGFLEFLIVAWFVWILSCGVRAVYDLPLFNAVSAALAPPAAMMTVLLVLLLIATGLHVAGAG